MNSFTIWALRGLAEKQGKSRLSQISDLIDGLPFAGNWMRCTIEDSD